MRENFNSNKSEKGNKTLVSSDNLGRIVFGKELSNAQMSNLEECLRIKNSGSQIPDDNLDLAESFFKDETVESFLSKYGVKN